MTISEKVILGLECCYTGESYINNGCSSCPYSVE